MRPRRCLGAALLVSSGAVTVGCASGGARPSIRETPPPAPVGASAEAPALRDSAGAVPTTVIVVRHAEKAVVEGDDPPLSDAGAARARALARALEDAGVTAVLITQYVRTAETAAPTARATGVTPQVVRMEWESTARDAGGVIAAAVRRHAGGVLLVVGHSTTVPEIVASLGAERPREICDSEYDRMEIVNVLPNGRARRIESRYGAPTPVEPECSSMR